MKGAINYPEKKKILFLSQQDFFPLNSTILDCLYYPDKPESDIEKRDEFVSRAKKLLKRMKFDSRDLNDIENRSIKDLSGGQRKKIKLLSIVIKKPDFLLLDESFNGLDRESKELAFDLLRTELSSTSTVIVIDHDKSFDDRYDKILELKKNGISESRNVNYYGR